MNREDAAKLWPIIKAFGDNEPVEIKENGKWWEVSNIPVSWLESPELIRIKPKPRTVTIAYVPGSEEFPPAIITNATIWIREGAKTIEVELPE